jgi:hypothetical protein
MFLSVMQETITGVALVPHQKPLQALYFAMVNSPQFHRDGKFQFRLPAQRLYFDQSDNMFATNDRGNVQHIYHS